VTQTNCFSEILDEADILLDVAADEKALVFSVAAEQAGRRELNGEEVAQSLLNREALDSTGLGHGVAIPHGRIKGLKAPFGIFMRLARPIPFGSPDGEPVHLIFVLLVPTQTTEAHLTILSQLAERFCNPEFREALAAANDAATVLNLFLA